MQVSDKKRTYYFQADASALGGILEEPISKIIPTQASVGLPAVGGFATARTEAFNLDQIVSCSSTYTRISGREAHQDGAVSILATAVIEDLNILEVVTAKRIVAQISVDVPAEGRHRIISLAGSHFEGLRLGGHEASPKLNSRLLTLDAGATWPDFQRIGVEQADRLIAEISQGSGRNTFGWALPRYQWMSSAQGGMNEPYALCSLVDTVDSRVPIGTRGHLVEIPDFGRLFFGEVLVTRTSIQLSMLRAELGCNVRGKVSGGVTFCNGHSVPPDK
jgi:hypothetical protein